MDCKTIDILIRKGLDAGLSENDRRTVDAHLAGCARCRTIVFPELEAEAVEAPPGLLEDVLRETSGPACQRASELLCRELDSELVGLDAELVDVHAGGCLECARLRTALSRIVEDLAGMRELAPSPRFVTEVLERTSRAAGPRLRELWIRLVRRPRFAWEAAYVGAMLFWLVLGAPISGGSERMAGILPELQRSSSSLASLSGNVSGLGRGLWDSAGNAWRSSVTRIESDLGDRSRRVQRSLAGVKQQGHELRQAIRAIDLAESRQAVQQQISREAREAVNNFVRDDDPSQE